MLLAAGGAADAAETAAVLAPSRGATHAIEPSGIGFNGRMTVDRPFDNPVLRDALRGTRVRMLRYPGGTVANFWDWTLGREPGNDRTDYPVSHLAEALAGSSIEPIFVLNMLTSDIEHARAGLELATQAGLPVDFIELGNEFYARDQAYEARFPTASDYAREAGRWIHALRPAYPRAKFGVVANRLPPNTTTRTGRWNELLVAALPADVDAYIIHCYTPGPGKELLGNPDKESPREIYDRLKTAEGAERLLAEPYRFGRQVFRKKALPQDDRPIWITEFGLRSDAIYDTWAHSLFLLEFSNVFLISGRVQIILAHNLDEAFVNSSRRWDRLGEMLGQELKLEPGAPSAVGHAMDLLGAAAGGLDRATRVEFDPQPTLRNASTGRFPAVFAWEFGSGAERRSLVVNVSALRYEVRLAAAARYEQVHAPLERPLVAFDSVERAKAEATATLPLPPFSVTVVDGPLTGGAPD